MLLLALTVSVLYGARLTHQPIVGEESRWANAAREMIETGDWLVPRLYGEPLFTKPPSMYLAIVLCSLPLGSVTEFTARLPSALAACACVLLF